MSIGSGHQNVPKPHQKKHKGSHSQPQNFNSGIKPVHTACIAGFNLDIIIGAKLIILL